jgi:Zn-dependent protease with chaperone function
MNLVAGRARSENAAVPEVMLFERPAPNAFIWGGRRPVIAMSRDAVEAFTRTEIEAMVAHCFVRLGSGAGRTLPIAVLLGRLAAWAGPLVGATHDVATAASTRYPPALRSALAKCAPARGTFAPSFFVAEGWSHSPVMDRVRALEDL